MSQSQRLKWLWNPFCDCDVPIPIAVCERALILNICKGHTVSILHKNRYLQLAVLNTWSIFDIVNFIFCEFVAFFCRPVLNSISFFLGSFFSSSSCLSFWATNIWWCFYVCLCISCSIDKISIFIAVYKDSYVVYARSFDRVGKLE